MKTFDDEDMSMEEILSSIKKHITKNKKNSSNEYFSKNNNLSKNVKNDENDFTSKNFEDLKTRMVPIMLIPAKKKNVSQSEKMIDNFNNGDSKNEFNFEINDDVSKEIEMPSFLQSIKNEVIAEKNNFVKKNDTQINENFQNKNDPKGNEISKKIFYKNEKIIDENKNEFKNYKNFSQENEILKTDQKIISKITENLSSEPIESLIAYTKKLAEIKEKKAEEERISQTKTLDKIFDEAIRESVSKWIDENLYNIVKEIVEKEIKRMISSIVD